MLYKIKHVTCYCDPENEDTMIKILSSVGVVPKIGHYSTKCGYKTPRTYFDFDVDFEIYSDILVAFEAVSFPIYLIE